MTDDLVTYFAYGSCMSPQDFGRTVPQFEVLGKAVLKDYRVGFTTYSEGRMGGVADIVQVPESQMEGVLYTFSPIFLPLLDRREGVGEGVYQRITVPVAYDGKRTVAQTYTVCHKAAQEIAPSDLYRDIVLDGARLLSDDYRQQLEEHIAQLQGSP